MRTFVAAALIAIAVAVAGCGFERQPPFAGARIPDVGPWQDRGPLTVCTADHARIVAPSLGTAGICAAAAADSTCSADSDCNRRERCLCGRCAVAVCDSADECGPADGPFVCTFADRRCDRVCAVDGDCGAGERCLAGRHICRGSCATTADCQRGESCQSSTGLCISSACTSDADCRGRACVVERIGALLAEPSPLVTVAGVELWVERSDGDGVARIWHARGADGTRFDLDAAPLFPGAAPSVARLADGSFAMIFADGASLFAARSPDGAAWSPPKPALPNARQPSLVVQPDGTPLVYAVDPDGNLTRFVGNSELVFSTPQIALSPASTRTPLWPDVDALASPFAEPYVDADGSARLRLWFAAHGSESAPSSQFGVPTPTPPDYSIGLAVSADGATLVPDAYDPVFDRTTDFINHPSELEPALVSLGDHWLLYYVRAKPDGSGAETLAFAVSPVVPR
ncbi:MAG: hypothetical protein JWM53_4187 [bacterium]|nr:hypothetical protein [bacterium]